MRAEYTHFPSKRTLQEASILRRPPIELSTHQPFAHRAPNGRRAIGYLGFTPLDGQQCHNAHGAFVGRKLSGQALLHNATEDFLATKPGRYSFARILQAELRKNRQTSVADVTTVNGTIEAGLLVVEPRHSVRIIQLGQTSLVGEVDDVVLELHDRWAETDLDTRETIAPFAGSLVVNREQLSPLTFLSDGLYGALAEGGLTVVVEPEFRQSQDRLVVTVNI